MFSDLMKDEKKFIVIDKNHIVYDYERNPKQMDDIEKKRQEDLVKNTGTKDPWAMEKTWEKAIKNALDSEEEQRLKLEKFWEDLDKVYDDKNKDDIDDFGVNSDAMEPDAFRRKHDLVNHPEHYTYGGIELLDFLDGLALSKQFNAFEWGYVMSILQYLVRYPLKNGLQDLRKAKFYLDRLIEMKACDEDDAKDT